MKTNKLMTAVALSAMFAACTQDAELNETLAKNDFSNIPMVEADFTVNTGVDSRMTNGYGWELNDKVGFVWLGDGSKINVTGDAYQNNPLYCVDADAKAFKSEGMFYVGNYFAYMPYTEGNTTIEPIKFNVTKQPLTADQADLAKHTIYISPEVYTLEHKDADGSVGEGNLPSGVGQNLPLNIARVSNFATIDLTFANAEDLNDLKVYSVSLDGKCGQTSVLPTSFVYAPKTSAAVTNKSWKNYNAVTFYAGRSENTYGAIEAASEAGLAVEDGALTVKMLTMPKNSSTTIDAFEIKIKTNYGDVTVDLDDKYDGGNEACIAFTEGGKDKTIANTSLFNDLGSAGTINVYVDMDNKTIGDLTVKTQDELAETLNMLATAGYEEPISITLNPDNANKTKNFVLKNFTLPEKLKCVVTLKPGDNTNGTVEFAGTTIIDKPVVVLGTPVVTGNMTVEYSKDAAYTFNCVTLTVGHDAVLVNNGVISGKLETVAADEDEGLGFGKYVNNSKEAKLVNSYIENNGEVQWIAGTAPTTKVKAVYAEASNLEDLININTAKVQLVHLVDGAVIENNTETYELLKLAVFKCYGNVEFKITDTPRGDEKALVFAGKSKLIVTENSEVLINSDNQKNCIGFNVINVGENAKLNIKNIEIPATINNAGDVVMTDVLSFIKGLQHEGSTWREINNN